jgi:hypothetical protein
LDFLDHACRATNCEPGWTATLTVLDLCAALLAFGGVRSVGELTQWLRDEVPLRARELAKAAASGKGGFDEIPPCSCLSAPPAANWH